MKKLLLPICAVLMCMTSCQKEGNDILNLVMEEYTSDAKLHLDDDGYTVWDDGDSVWLSGGKYIVNVDGTKATIRDVLLSKDNIYTAIYPYTLATDATSITYPSTQKYEESNGIQKIAAPMAGVCGNGENTLKFHNLGAIIAVNVTNSTSEAINVKKIEVIADGDVELWGNYDIYSDYSINYVDGGDSKVTLDCGWNGVSVASGGSKKFYIALPPVEAKLTVKVYDDYYYYTKGQQTSFPLERSHGYNAGITATSSDAARTQYAPFNTQIMYTTTDGQALGDNFLSRVGTVNGDSYQVDGNWFTTFESTLTIIPYEAFAYSVPYNEFIAPLVTITLPTSVTSVGNGAFRAIKSLKYISMPGLISNPGGFFAFKDCTALETIILGPSVIGLEENTFDACTGIRDFYCYSTNPPTINVNYRDATFYNCNLSSATLHVPAGQASAYRSTGWSDFGTILEDL